MQNIDQKKLFTQLFEIFEKELLNIFEYVGPSESNYYVYWNRIHELLLRIWSECLNLAKEIVIEITSKKGEDYLKISTSDCYYDYLTNNLALNKKTIQFIWWLMLGENIYIRPFEKTKPEKENEGKTELGWESEEIMEWWTHYNKLKHEKLKYYEKCCLKDIIYAFWAYYILLNYLVIWYETEHECNKTFLINPWKDFWMDTSIFSPTCACAYSTIPIPIHWKIWRIIEDNELEGIQKFLDSQEIKAPSNLDLDAENCLYYTFLWIKEQVYWIEYAKTINDLKNLPTVKILQSMFWFVNKL